jgi:hypothetical protein
MVPINVQISKLKRAYKDDDEDKQTEILEKLEDDYHKDLTDFYGEDFSDSRVITKIKNKLKGQVE